MCILSKLKKTKKHRKVEGSMRKVIFSALVLASMVGMLFGAPFQTLGMLRTPDAYVLPHKAGEILLVGYYRDVAKPTSDMDKFGKFVPYGMLGVGLGDRVELGLFGGDKIFYMNAKVKVIEETLRIPQVAVGMDNIFSSVQKRRAQDESDPADWYYAQHPDKTDYEYYSAYVVGSKQVVIGRTNWMFNLGAGSNRFTGQVPRSRIFNGLFYSVEFSPIKDLYLQGEYSGHDFQVGVKYTIDNFGIKLGTQAIEDLFKDNGYEDNFRIALGVSYLFDKYAKAKRRPDIVELAKGAIDLEPELEIVTGDLDVPGAEITTPEVVVVEPEITTPEVVVTEPEITTPEVVVTEPEVTTPEVVVTEPEVTTPEVEVTEPEVTTPEVVVTEPEVTTPEVVVVEPEITTPEVVVVEPEITTPEVVVTEPEITTPEVVVVEPEITKPEVTTPGVSGEISLGGLEFITPGSGGDIIVQGGTYRELSPEIKDLLEELRKLREEREKAQKALLDLREWLKELKQK